MPRLPQPKLAPQRLEQPLAHRRPHVDQAFLDHLDGVEQPLLLLERDTCRARCHDDANIALTAFRVTREMPVTVPDLGGKSEADVDKALAAVGLKPEIEKGGGLIEDLLPGDPAACEQDPSAGTQVRRGSTVHVVLSKSC